MEFKCGWGAEYCGEDADFYGILPHHNCGEFVCFTHVTQDWYQDLTPIEEYDPKDYGYGLAIIIEEV